jgi:hypothetical protein
MGADVSLQVERREEVSMSVNLLACDQGSWEIKQVCVRWDARQWAEMR